MSQKATEIAARFRRIADFEPAARELMPHAVYEFVAGAAGDELTLADNNPKRRSPSNS